MMNTMKYDAILWDLDTTLLDPIIPEHVAIRKCFEDFGFGYCTDEMLALYHPINIRWWDRILTEGKTKEEITVGRFSEFLAVCKKDNTKAKEFNDEYMNIVGDTICPTPNALETVRFLKGKVKQYIATNGLVAAQSKKISNSGLDRLADGIFISETVGYDKPDVEYYDCIFNHTGLTDRSRILMVGDSLTTDMQGGNNAGIVCCWYNPEHKENNSAVRIDYDISDIAMVSDIVSEFGFTDK